MELVVLQEYFLSFENNDGIGLTQLQNCASSVMLGGMKPEIRVVLTRTLVQKYWATWFCRSFVANM